ncbi:MAG: hypothetical protein KGH98_02515 [Candidatus Micrarchaeota archaeon]|nr:hypothetical protein [Candidatus Micrarchaeota archaeon]
MAEEKKSVILFKDKQTRILLSLRSGGTQEWYIATLAKAAGTTYVHTYNFIAECEARGITTVERHGNIKVVRLTGKGTQIADMLANIYSMMEAKEQPQAPAQEQQINA